MQNAYPRRIGIGVKVVIEYDLADLSPAALGTPKKERACLVLAAASGIQLLYKGIPELAGAADNVFRRRERPYNRFD